MCLVYLENLYYGTFLESPSLGFYHTCLTAVNNCIVKIDTAVIQLLKFNFCSANNTSKHFFLFLDNSIHELPYNYTY